MPKLRFTYFDIKGSRGQVGRLAMEFADIEFEDVRLKFPDFLAQRDSFPYRAIPILEVDGTVVAQSNGINRYLGKLAKLYPTDPLQAALCDEVMDAVEDVTNKVQVTLFIKDEEEKKLARQALADGPIPAYLRQIAARLEARGGQYFADGRLTVADLKVFVWVKSLRSGILDHVPADLVETHAPTLLAHHDMVWAVPKVRAHYE